MRNLTAVTFDLDDTLYPERDYALSGFAAVARWAEDALGIPQATGFAELKGYFQAGVRGDTFNRWLDSHGLEAEAWIPQMVQVYRDHEPQLQPFPDVPPVLNELRPRCRMGLLTQGHRPGQERKIRALGLTDYFEAIVIMGEEQRDSWKPNTLPFEMLLEKLATPGEQAVYIGDHPERDFYGAREMGLATIRVRREGGEHSEKEAPGPEYASDWEVADFAALHVFLRSMMQGAP